MTRDGCTVCYAKDSNRESKNQVAAIDLNRLCERQERPGDSVDRPYLGSHGAARTVSMGAGDSSFFGTSVSLGAIG